MSHVISGPAYVVKDNIDTDQIIPAQYLMLVPTVQAEYEKLGSFAMIGLPESLYPTRFVEPGQTKTKYAVLIGGKNLGCGSSREHAPIALGAAGCKVSIAETYARIFFRNCIATGEVFPYESNDRLVDEVNTGDHVGGRFREGRGPRQRQDLQAQAAGRRPPRRGGGRHLQLCPEGRDDPAESLRSWPTRSRCWPGTASAPR